MPTSADTSTALTTLADADGRAQDCRSTVPWLIRRWLRAGILEGGVYADTVEGTPQGAGISPLLANIFLHYVLTRKRLTANRRWSERDARGGIIIFWRRLPRPGRPIDFLCVHNFRFLPKRLKCQHAARTKAQAHRAEKACWHLEALSHGIGP